MSELTPLLRRFCDYSITFKNNTPASIVNMRSLLKRFIEFTPTHTTMDLTKRVVKEWIFYGREQWDWSPKTIRNQLQAISSFCSWLVEEEIMPENPAKDIRRPKLKKALPRTLSKDDALTVLEWSQHYPSRNRLERTRAPAIIGIFLFTGLRKSELLNLKLEDVRLDEGELFVREGKGQKDRLVPMSQRLQHILRIYKKERDRRDRTCPYFFSSLFRDIRMSEVAIKRLVIKLREKSKVYFYPHLLRHTFATLMVQGGCPISDLSEMMGHTCISTTAIYLHATTAHLKHQIKKHPLGS